MSKSQPSTDSASDTNSTTRFRHLSPEEQPESVHEISEALYRPFTAFANKRATELKFHISGCLIDPVPFVQLACGEYRLLDGQEVSIQHADSLGLKQLKELEHPPNVWSSAENREKYSRQLDSLARKTELAKAADGKQWIVWCHHVHGTLTAETAEDSIEIPFSLWAARLAAGLDQCPAWRCPITGIETYDLAIDDEGNMVDAASIMVCEETGRRLLKSRISECQVTGKRVDSELLMNCPVRNYPFLKRLAKTCQGCFQSVDPNGLVNLQCNSCRTLRKIKSNDFRSDQVLSGLIRHQPWLNRVQKIKLATQPQFWLVQFQFENTTWRTVIDRQSLKLCGVSCRKRWFGPWEKLDPKNWPTFLETDRNQALSHK